MARELHKRGHEVSVLTSYEKAVPGHTDFELVQELDLGKRPNREARAEMLRDHTSRLRPDLIIVHRYFAEEYGAIVQSWGYPVVEVVHQHRKLTGAKFYIYNTEYTRRANGADRDRNQIVIIPPAYPEVAAETHGDKIGFVKPLPGKGIDFLYSIIDRMPERKFLILRGEYQPLETIIEKSNVWFLNPIENMKDFYAQCRIMLMPSLSEDAGTIPQEASMNQIPCISSNVMGLPETNAGGIILPHNVDLWVASICALDEPRYYRKIADSQNNVLQMFQWDKKFDELDKRIRA